MAPTHSRDAIHVAWMSVTGASRGDSVMEISSGRYGESQPKVVPWAREMMLTVKEENISITYITV